MTPQEAAKLKTDFISYGLNSDISPENWNPDEVKKYQSVEGKTTWEKFRMAVTQERKKNASLETDLRKAKAREAKTKKEVKQEKAKSRNSNKVIDNLRSDPALNAFTAESRNVFCLLTGCFLSLPLLVISVELTSLCPIKQSINQSNNLRFCILSRCD